MYHFECDMSCTGSCVQILGSQLGVLSGKVIEPVGQEASLVGVGHCGSTIFPDLLLCTTLQCKLLPLPLEPQLSTLPCCNKQFLKPRVRRDFSSPQVASVGYFATMGRKVNKTSVLFKLL